MDFGIITALSSNPDITKAAITGLATSIGKVVGESWLNKLGLGGGKLLNGMGNLTQQGKDLLVPVAKKYIENYADRHGQLKVLGMGKPINLESIYTQVNFDPELIRTFGTIDMQEEAFRIRSWSKKDCRLGMKVANDNHYLMVLGSPGMGKTTFLRKVGLEALKQKKGEYKHTCIPVFLELRKYRWEKSYGINLESKIAEEFQHCGLKKYQSCAQKLLEEGKLLILLDGLDEVPTELLEEMTTAIKNMVDCYPKNRFIASCRIAAYRPFQNFDRFTDVVISNFDDSQIKYFIDSWFKSHDQPEWGKECWIKLSDSDHKATRELTQTPLLLTLICILFMKRGEFPSNRATLYKEAVWTMLAEWDASKQIIRQKLYKDLDTRCKEVMLAEIAYQNLANNNLFFQQGEVSQQIEKILQEILIEEKLINGREVLRAVEEQHGILVNRYEDIYSFSHLTIQEFLTAEHIILNNFDINQIVTEHLYKPRWHEVFLLLAGLRKADGLLLAIEQNIQTYMYTPKLKELLAWVEKVSSPKSGDIRATGKRAIAIANDICHANMIAKAHSYAEYYNNAIVIASSSSNTNADKYSEYYHDAMEITIANARSVTRNHHYIGYAINYFIAYAEWAIRFEIYKELDLPNAINLLKKLENQIPGDMQPEQVTQDFAQHLIQIVQSAFCLTSA